jgi:hypothetical protein
VERGPQRLELRVERLRCTTREGDGVVESLACVTVERMGFGKRTLGGEYELRARRRTVCDKLEQAVEIALRGPNHRDRSLGEPKLSFEAQARLEHRSAHVCERRREIARVGLRLESGEHARGAQLARGELVGPTPPLVAPLRMQSDRTLDRRSAAALVPLLGVHGRSRPASRDGCVDDPEELCDTTETIARPLS